MQSSPFGIRRDLLQLAKDIIQYNTDTINGHLMTKWMEVDSKLSSAGNFPDTKTYTVNDVILAAQELNKFVNDRRV